MKNIILLTCILISIQTFAQTSLTGKVTDAETGEPILFGTVSLFKDGSLVTGTDTDLDGFYNFPNIDPGTYDVEVSHVGYVIARLIDILVRGGQTNKADIQLGTGGGIDLNTIVVTKYKVPFVEQDKTSANIPLTSDQLKNLPIRNLKNLPITNISKLASSVSCLHSKKEVRAQKLPHKLPSRTINNTVQNMLDLKISSIDYKD